MESKGSLWSNVVASKNGLESNEVDSKVQSKLVTSTTGSGSKLATSKDVESKGSLWSNVVASKDGLQSKDMMLKDSFLTDNEVSSMPFDRLLDSDFVDWICPDCTLKNTTSLFACVCEACGYEELRHRYSPTVSIDSHSNEISKVSTNSPAKRKQKRAKTHFDVSLRFPNLVIEIIIHSITHISFVIPSCPSMIWILFLLVNGVERSQSRI